MIEGVIVDPMDHDLRPSEGTIVIKNSARIGFGTGLPPNDKDVLVAYLKKYLKPGMDVPDLGCGSGILAILAKKLGANRVLAVDNDPLAIEVATDNASEKRC